jgi:hypothetical protein
MNGPDSRTDKHSITLSPADPARLVSLGPALVGGPDARGAGRSTILTALTNPARRRSAWRLPSRGEARLTQFGLPFGRACNAWIVRLIRIHRRRPSPSP